MEFGSDHIQLEKLGRHLVKVQGEGWSQDHTVGRDLTVLERPRSWAFLEELLYNSEMTNSC